jgi:non-ribosomal peptide synthetase component F
VLDDKLQPVPVREIGDLYISGVGLSPGYWRDQQKTSAAFIHNPHSPDSQSSDPANRLYRTGDLRER